MVWFETEAETGHLPIFDEIFSEISHQKMTECKNRLASLLTTESVESVALLENLLALPTFGQIVETYKKLPMILWKSSENITRRNHWKVIFLFHIMNISGLCPDSRRCAAGDQPDLELADRQRIAPQYHAAD